jgi:hypothetical protein
MWSGLLTVLYQDEYEVRSEIEKMYTSLWRSSLTREDDMMTFCLLGGFGPILTQYTRQTVSDWALLQVCAGLRRPVVSKLYGSLSMN